MEQNFRHVITEFANASLPGVPKHMWLRNAILSAIRKGYLKPGDQLPPEQEFSRAIGLSLGTVQRALSNLAGERAVTREQGRGTFIAKPELSFDVLWQFRFREQFNGPILPISIELLDRRLVQDRLPWLDALGDDEQGYCELTRIITVNKSLRCLSRFYVRVSRFPKIMKVSLSRIPGNLKEFFAEQFNSPTQALDQFISPLVLERSVCSLLKIKRNTGGMVINSIGRSVGQEAITFQRLWIPNNRYFLEMSTDRRPSKGARLA